MEWRDGEITLRSNGSDYWEVLAFCGGRFLYAADDGYGRAVVCPVCAATVRPDDHFDSEELDRPELVAAARSPVVPEAVDAVPFPPRVWEFARLLAETAALEPAEYGGDSTAYVGGRGNPLAPYCQTPIFCGTDRDGVRVIAEAHTPAGSFVVVECPTDAARVGVVCSWGAVYVVPAAARPAVPITGI